MVLSLAVLGACVVDAQAAAKNLAAAPAISKTSAAKEKSETKSGDCADLIITLEIALEASKQAASIACTSLAQCCDQNTSTNDHNTEYYSCIRGTGDFNPRYDSTCASERRDCDSRSSQRDGIQSLLDSLRAECGSVEVAPVTTIRPSAFRDIEEELLSIGSIANQN